MVLWELISGFENQVRPQEIDDEHLDINFGPLGVNIGLYRILQMIRIENINLKKKEFSFYKRTPMINKCKKENF